MRNLEELNLNEGGDPVDRPPPTPDQLAAIEQIVGAKLPSDYTDFLRFSNGGHPELDTLYLDFGDDLEEWSVNRFFEVSDDQDSTESVMWNYHHRWRGAPRQLLPIAADGGGNLYLLDLSESNYGQVVLWVHDDSSVPLLTVAPDFGTLIDSLEMAPDN